MMTRIEAITKILSFKKILPAASQEIDEIVNAIAISNSTVKGKIKKAQFILAENPSDNINKAYNILTEVLKELK